ncbi:putative C4-dicarboxylase binding protein, periplasmic protein [[Synechococcus] sp. NIES-970]|nr:putative C4-dicarboxylase binding protein, periplasmic protein [[Synechococcus] sp. NIES-970]
MTYSRRNFLWLTGATSSLAIATSQWMPQARGASTVDQDILNQVLPFPGQYGEYYQQAKIKAYHLHNQPTESILHQALESFWIDVFKQTQGELFVTPIPLDASMPAGDPQAVQLVAAGRFEIVSVAGPIIDKLCPEVIGIQNIGFIHESSQDVFEIINQPLFAEICHQSVSRYNLTYLPHGTFNNGMRNITSIEGKPLYTIEDFQDLIIRVPPSQDISETMKALGAIPKQYTMNQVFTVLQNSTVQAQENPLSVVKGFQLYEVTKYLNITNHTWSGYNMFFNTPFWESLSVSVQEVISRLLPIYQAQQIKAQEDYNTQLFSELTEELGMIATQPDTSMAPRKLVPVYRSIYQQLNPQARSLIKAKLEAKTGVSF